MLNNAVIAVFRNREQARLAVHILDRADFPMEHASLIAVHLDTRLDEAKEASYGDDSIHSSFVGAGLGSIVGVLVGATIVAFAGPGVALVAGPVAGLLTGGATGALLGAMEGWGIHEPQLQHYRKLLKY